MKKVFALMSIVAVFAMVSCGPSAEEKAKAEQKRQDDSAKAAQITADSLAAAQAAAEAAVIDTTVKVDTTVAPAVK